MTKLSCGTSSLLVLTVIATHGVSPALGQTSAALDAALSHKETAVARIKARLEAGTLGIANGTVDATTCAAQSACTSSLNTHFCSSEFGSTRGCACAGRAIDTTDVVVKASPKLRVTDRSLKRTSCLGKHLAPELVKMYSTMIETGTTKWLYYGSKDGVLVNFPGFAWSREADPNTCDATYDSRLRPWQMSAATGPKNVILILDVSGSMMAANRIGLLRRAAKKVIDSMTHADYIGVIEFDSVAQTYAGLTTLAKALPGFRDRLKAYVDGLQAGGGTDFASAYRKAFELVDQSLAKKYSAGCHTTYVFVTDGVSDSPKDLIVERQTRVKDEHHFVVSLGSGTDEASLRQLSCDIGAVFSSAGDGDETALQDAMIAYYKYYALQKSLAKVEGYSWTEPYTSIPDIWGPTTSVSAPVYDKSREPWHMLGVASVDSTVCDLIEKAPEPPASATLKTTTGCECVAGAWSYNGVNYEGCTNADWSVPWCATPPGCGVSSTSSVSTGFWDDCNPTGREGTVEEELNRRATSYCEHSALPPCALEAIRVSIGGSNNRCYPAACPAEDRTIDNYTYAIDGPAAAAATSYALRSSPGRTDGTEFDADGGTCDCSIDMKPKCVCAAVNAAKREAEEAAAAADAAAAIKKKEDDEERARVGAIAGVIVGAIVGGLVVVALISRCACSRGARANAGLAGLAPPQVLQMQPVILQQQPQLQPQPQYQPPQASYLQHQPPQVSYYPQIHGQNPPMAIGMPAGVNVPPPPPSAPPAPPSYTLAGPAAGNPFSKR